MSYPKKVRRPVGTDNQAIFAQMVWDMIHDPKTNIFVDSPTIHFDKTPNGYVPRIKIPNAAPEAEWPWMYPQHVELDPTQPYSAGFCAYISPLSTLATTGMTDLVSNATVISPSGIWLAMQDIPVTAGGSYNMPQKPVPGAGGSAPSGTPLTGDLDSAGVYWAFVAGGPSGGGAFADFWSSSVAYQAGSIVQVLTTTTYGGIKILPGTYVLRQGLSTTPSPTGNQIPQYPYPSGTINWIYISPMPNLVSTCAGGSSASIYVASSATF